MPEVIDANDLLRVSSISISDLKLQSQLIVTGSTNSDSSSPPLSRQTTGDEDFLLTRPDIIKSQVKPKAPPSPPAPKSAPPPPQPRLTSILNALGYLAAVAGGHKSPPFNSVFLQSCLKLGFAVPSLLLNLLIVPLLVYDSIHSYYFWAQSLNESYAKYANRLLRRRSIVKAPCTEYDQDDFDTTRWDPQPWGGRNPLTDLTFVCYTYLLCFFHLREICNSAHISAFRRFLGSHPPHFPISANDDIFRYDEKGSRFQLSMLVVVDQISHAEVREAFRRRWIEWEPKTHAVCDRLWGRPCWRVLDEDEFDLDSHIIHKLIDAKERTIAEMVSEMASEEMDHRLPQWQVWVTDCVQSVDDIASSGDESPCCQDVAKMTYICGKWNHTYSDGVGMMNSIVNRLGDKGVSMDKLPEQYRLRVPWWKVILFYTYHAIRAACQFLEHFCYAAWGIPEYAAMIQPAVDKQISVPPTHSGRKHYSRAGVFLLQDINKLRLKIRDALGGPKLTVNDLFLYCLTAAWARLKCPDQLEMMIRECIDQPTDVNAAHAKQPLPPQDHQLQVIIPMMCRTGVPTCMDNFTSLVPAIIPLPQIGHPHETRQQWRLRVLTDMLKTKETLDSIKSRDQRTTMFLMMCILCKALPGNWTEKIYRLMYRKMQFCSTNVAAPPIESRFFGRDVHGLFFWPAVPACCTGGASIVSLGDRFQMLTVVDEVELTPALEVAERLLAQNNYEITQALRTRIIVTLADLIPLLVRQEFESLINLLH